MAEALEKRKREAEEKRGALGRQWTCQIESCAREIDDVSIKKKQPEHGFEGQTSVFQNF